MNIPSTIEPAAHIVLLTDAGDASAVQNVVA